MKPVSSGIVIVRKDGNEYKVLMMRAYQHWDAPKGHVETGEDILDTAMREVEEETTLQPDELSFKWGYDEYTTEPFGKKGKIVHYFVAETYREKITLPVSDELGRPEHDEWKWMTFDEARQVAKPRIVKVLNWAEDKILG